MNRVPNAADIPLTALFTSCTSGTFSDLSACDASFFQHRLTEQQWQEDQQNNNLYTASAYITAKFRQHDNSQEHFHRHYRRYPCILYD